MYTRNYSEPLLKASPPCVPLEGACIMKGPTTINSLFYTVDSKIPLDHINTPPTPSRLLLAAPASIPGSACHFDKRAPTTKRSLQDRLLFCCHFFYWRKRTNQQHTYLQAFCLRARPLQQRSHRCRLGHGGFSSLVIFIVKDCFFFSLFFFRGVGRPTKSH